MAIDVNAVMAALEGNKKKGHSRGEHDHVHKMAKKRTRRFSSKPLGHFVGHCPKCQISMGYNEVSHLEQDPHESDIRTCTRCGVELPHVDDLEKEVNRNKLLEWRRHDTWGNRSIPAPVEVGKHDVGYCFPLHNVL